MNTGCGALAAIRKPSTSFSILFSAEKSAAPLAYNAVEGPGARKLEVWQGIHWPYWTRLLEPHGLEPHEDMIIMVEHFDLVYPTPD
jgi:uncharacterized protein YhfF